MTGRGGNYKTTNILAPHNCTSFIATTFLIPHRLFALDFAPSHVHRRLLVDATINLNGYSTVTRILWQIMGLPAGAAVAAGGASAPFLGATAVEVTTHRLDA